MRISKLAIRTVGKAEVVPKGYGLAYWDFARNEGIFFLMPFNLIARLWMRLYYTLMQGGFPNKFEGMVQREYHRGYQDAIRELDGRKKSARESYEDGYKDGYEGFADFMLADLDKRKEERDANR